MLRLVTCTLSSQTIHEHDPLVTTEMRESQRSIVSFALSDPDHSTCFKYAASLIDVNLQCNAINCCNVPAMDAEMSTTALAVMFNICSLCMSPTFVIRRQFDTSRVVSDDENVRGIELIFVPDMINFSTVPLSA